MRGETDVGYIGPTLPHDRTGMTYYLIASLIVVGVLSAAISPRVRTSEGFFRGFDDEGGAPGLWTLVLSQVTTWIFARSLLNAAILGYLFGIAGALAYSAYYGSFLVGAHIVDSLRFRHGHESVQTYLAQTFGRTGEWTYNFVVALRLVSEVFANLLVVGIIFGAAGSFAYSGAIVAIAGVTLAYSLIGGLRASLHTDVLQMIIFLVLLVVVLVIVVAHPAFDMRAILVSSPDIVSPGWILLAVALLQVWSYPLHDPVMMDRGFLADRSTTKRSFYHAFWISFACILSFGLVGVFAGLNKLPGEALMDSMMRLLGAPALLLVNLALVVSAVSTLDSALASASKLAVVDMRLAPATVRNGRIAMCAFLVAGIGLLFVGSKDLFSAVAVSGTASMFLAPVIVFCIWGGARVKPWAYIATFALSMMAAIAYFLDNAGHFKLLTMTFGDIHDYTKLLIVSAGVLVAGFALFAIALERKPAA
ncbi:MAG: hypothetical protein K2Y29_07280 [Beijerinckiaceae bacterium]|nr:hypothetical protein [Beijerinckiaceae bacterium]